MWSLKAEEIRQFISSANDHQRVEPPVIYQLATPLVLIKEQGFHIWRRSKHTSFFIFSFLSRLFFFHVLLFYTSTQYPVWSCQKNIMGRNKSIRISLVIASLYYSLLQKPMDNKGNFISQTDMLRWLAGFPWDISSRFLRNTRIDFVNIVTVTLFPRWRLVHVFIVEWLLSIVQNVINTLGCQYIEISSLQFIHKYKFVCFPRHFSLFFGQLLHPICLNNKWFITDSQNLKKGKEFLWRQHMMFLQKN